VRAMPARGPAAARAGVLPQPAAARQHGGWLWCVCARRASSRGVNGNAHFFSVAPQRATAMRHSTPAGCGGGKAAARRARPTQLGHLNSSWNFHGAVFRS
jgi:hypothetical protein